MPRFIRVDCDCPHHPKTMRLARLCAKPAEHVFGALVTLWTWAADKRPDGSLAFMDPLEVESAAGWSGKPGLLAHALLSCRITESGSGYVEGSYGEADLRLHDWKEHQGYIAKERERKAEVARYKREKSSGSGALCSALRSARLSVEVARDIARTEEKRREESRKEIIEPPYPPSGESPGETTRSEPNEPSGFPEFWDAYPRRIGKQAARRAWEKTCRGHPERPGLLLEAIRRQVATSHFRGRDGQDYHPNPATWLNQGRWEDELHGPRDQGAAPGTAPDTGRAIEPGRFMRGADTVKT